MKKWLGASLIILTLLYVVCLGWLYAQHVLFYRRIVLEVPIRLEAGFSFTRPFTVDLPISYWVEIQYDDVFRSSVEMPVPRDEFSAEFEVMSRDRVIAKGGTASGPEWKYGGPAPWAVSRDHVIRQLSSFNGKRGEPYELSLRITGAEPRLTSKRAKALVEVDWRFDEFRPVRESLLLGTGIVISILILLSTWSMLRSRRDIRRLGSHL